MPPMNNIRYHHLALPAMLITVLLMAAGCTLLPDRTGAGVGGGGRPEETLTPTQPSNLPDLPLYDGGDGYTTSLSVIISIGEQRQGRIEALNEAHNYLFQGRAGQAITIRVQGGEDGTDTRLKLIAPTGAVLASADDVEGRDPVLAYTLPADGLYTARIDTYSPGGYTLTLSAGDEAAIPEGVRIDPTLPLFDAGDGYTTTVLQPIAVGDVLEGEFASVFDAHNYVFRAEAGQTLTIRVQGAGTDTRLKLLGPDGALLEVQDDTQGEDPIITYTFAAAGDYTARIDTWTPGGYTVALEG
ncbi:MAG: hypothetical protein Kow00124_20330 [Anaerolineae bacterium]